jgi:thioredoxin 2
MGGKLIFVKIDTEANQALGAQYNIRSIPTLAVFKNGQEFKRVSGALPPAQLQALIQQVLV